MKSEKWRKALLHADSYARIDVMMDAFSDLPRPEWFVLLGEAWSGFENVARWRAELRFILKRASREELDAMMEQPEREALALLPERITVYRGCYALNRSGLSWTLDRAQAERFPSLLRYRVTDQQPILRIGTTARNRVVLKLDRKEQEVIAPTVWGITERPIEIMPLECVFGECGHPEHGPRKL